MPVEEAEEEEVVVPVEEAVGEEVAVEMTVATEVTVVAIDVSLLALEDEDPKVAVVSLLLEEEDGVTVTVLLRVLISPGATVIEN